MATGRFAPSPTGDLHLGSLRTAMLAWLFARSSGGWFLLRVEDLDPVTSSRHSEARQRADLAALGLDWDGPAVRQSDRRDRHEAALADLEERGLTYPCFCTRREIREASQAPHGQDLGAYPGTCRDLTEVARSRQAADRPAAIRLRSTAGVVSIVDRLHGRVELAVDDVVLRRNDGVPAYNLAVVVDDAEQGIEEVVRGDDLLSSTPRQARLSDLLGFARPSWAHVPLVLGADGQRLAKRHGAVSLADLAVQGQQPAEVRARLAASVGMAEPGEPVSMAQLLDRFDPGSLPVEPWVLGRQPGDGDEGR
jgi:glutamyl-tRNA synthetase